MITHSHEIDVARTCAGVLLVPAIWPLSFIGTAILFPKAIDPLLGGLQNFLYFPALVWLLTILGSTLAVSRLFRLARTNALFFVTGIGCALTCSFALCAYGAWGDYNLVGKPGVLFPDHSDAGYELMSFVKLAAFSSIITAVTAGAFLGLGAFRLFKSQAI